MGKNLTGGTSDLLGGIGNISKDLINKLQKQEVKDEIEKED